MTTESELLEARSLRAVSALLSMAAIVFAISDRVDRPAVLERLATRIVARAAEAIDACTLPLRETPGAEFAAS